MLPVALVRVLNLLLVHFFVDVLEELHADNAVICGFVACKGLTSVLGMLLVEGVNTTRIEDFINATPKYQSRRGADDLSTDLQRGVVRRSKSAIPNDKDGPSIRVPRVKIMEGLGGALSTANNSNIVWLPRIF